MKISGARISPVRIKYTWPVSGVTYIHIYRLDTRDTIVSPDKSTYTKYTMYNIKIYKLYDIYKYEIFIPFIF